MTSHLKLLHEHLLAGATICVFPPCKRPLQDHTQRVVLDQWEFAAGVPNQSAELSQGRSQPASTLWSSSRFSKAFNATMSGNCCRPRAIHPGSAFQQVRGVFMRLSEGCSSPDMLQICCRLKDLQALICTSLDKAAKLHAAHGTMVHWTFSAELLIRSPCPTPLRSWSPLALTESRTWCQCTSQHAHEYCPTRFWPSQIKMRHCCALWCMQNLLEVRQHPNLPI